MRTHGLKEKSITHWGLSGEIGEEQRGVGSWEEITWGEMADIGDGGWRQQTMLLCMHLCNKSACSAHVPQNLKYNKKFVKKRKESLKKLNKLLCICRSSREP